MSAPDDRMTERDPRPAVAVTRSSSRLDTGSLRALRIANLAIGAAIGTLFPFIPAILAARGFTAAAIGTTLSVVSIGVVISVPIWGHLADVVLGRPRAVQVAAVGSVLATALLAAPFPALLIAGGLLVWNVLASAFPMLGDALAVNVLRGARSEYGRIRQLASFSFAVAAIVGGICYDRFGYDAAYVLFGISALTLAVAVAWLPDAPLADLAAMASSDAKPLEAEAPDVVTVGATDVGATAISGPRLPREAWGAIGVSFRRAPTLGGMLLAVGLIGLGFVVSSTFLPLRLLELGAEPSTIAISVAISALFEMPVMLFGTRLAKWLGLRGFFVAGSVLYAIAFASWAFLDSPLLIVISRVATGFAFGCITVSSVLAVGTLLPPELQATGQALRTTAFGGVAAVGANLVGGLVYASAGSSALFRAAAVTSVAGILVAIRYLPGRPARVAASAPV